MDLLHEWGERYKCQSTKKATTSVFEAVRRGGRPRKQSSNPEIQQSSNPEIQQSSKQSSKHLPTLPTALPTVEPVFRSTIVLYGWELNPGCSL
jgi:hypothetical protein